MLNLVDVAYAEHVALLDDQRQLLPTGAPLEQLLSQLIGSRVDALEWNLVGAQNCLYA